MDLGKQLMGHLSPLSRLSVPDPESIPSKGEDEFHHTCDISAHEETAAHRKDTSLARKESQLSWGSDQQMGSGKDPGAIFYASLAPLKYFSPEDSIYVNCPSWKPKPEPALAVEYASTAGSRPQPSKSATLQVEPRI